jgi:hypothetical protein
MYSQLQLQILKGRDHLEDLGVKGSLVLKWIFVKYDVKVYTIDLAGSGYGPLSGFCEHGDEHSGSIKVTESLERRSC